MNQVVKNLACEWAKDNIRANAVAPWLTHTPMVEQVILKVVFFLSRVERRCYKADGILWYGIHVWEISSFNRTD